MQQHKDKIKKNDFLDEAILASVKARKRHTDDPFAGNESDEEEKQFEKIRMREILEKEAKDFAEERELRKINPQTAPKLKESRSESYPDPNLTGPRPVRWVVQKPSPEIPRLASTTVEPLEVTSRKAKPSK